MNRNKKASKIGTAAAILASVILSGTTAFAYTPMQTTYSSDPVPTMEDSFSFRDTNSSVSTFLTSDICFVTEDNEVIPVNEADVDNRAILCSHVYKSGYADRHFSQSDGGCIVKTYTAKICKKCNHLVYQDLLSTHTYVKCPHK